MTASWLPESVVENLRPIWDDKLWTVQGDVITFGRLGVAIGVLVFGVFFSILVRKIIANQLMRRTRFSLTAVSAFGRLLLIFMLLFWIMLALDIVHIPVTAFAFLGGSLALGLGFGAKDIISNFISGFILMAERPIKIGDVIEVEGEVGKVEAIGVRSTRIHTENNVHIIIPNSVFLEQKIVNWTLSDNMVLTPIEVGVAYGTDLTKATEIMVAAARRTEGVLTQPKAFVLFWDIADSSLNFQVYFAAEVHNKMERWIMQSRVRYNVVADLTAAGIVIAFPQRDVHLDTSSPLEVRVRSEGP